MMGGSFNHLALFGPTRQQVAEVLADREAAISPTVNGFTLVADEESESLDSKRILAVSTEVSKTLRCPALLIQQFKGDVLCYSLFDNGTLVDDYNSEPDYYDFEAKHVPPRGPQGGDAERLCTLLSRTGARERVDHILHRQDPTLDAHQRYRELADALGIPGFSVGFGVGVLHRNYPEGLEESAVFLTATACESRETEKEWSPRRQLKREEQTLQSGKRIVQSTDLNGGLVTEVHVHRNPRGLTAIALEMRFATGRKTGETYFLNGRLVSRDVYEGERLQYPDMPAADAFVRDIGAEGLEERALRQEAQQAPETRTDPTLQNDLFCTTVMLRGRRANAMEWVQSESHTFEEMDSTSSRALILNLVKLGAAAIHACNIHSAADGHETSGRMVVELPGQPAARAAVLRAIRPFAKHHGYAADVDHGQRYAYARIGP